MKNLFKFNKEKNEVELKPINVPTNWDEITLGTYQKLQEYYKSLKDDEPIDTIKFIALLSNYSEDEVLLLPVAFVNNIVLKLDFLKKIPNPNVSNKITISGETYYLLNMDEMKFGEFTDVNMSIKNNPNDYASILAILCRKPNEIYDQEFINKRFEERKEMFENISVNQALSVLGFFFEILRTIQDTFSGLYQPTQTRGRIICDQYRKFTEKWGLQRTFYVLCEEKVEKIPEIAQTNLTDALMFLSYMKDKNDAEYEQEKFDDIQRKLKR